MDEKQGMVHDTRQNRCKTTPPSPYHTSRLDKWSIACRCCALERSRKWIPLTLFTLSPPLPSFIPPHPPFRGERAAYTDLKIYIYIYLYILSFLHQTTKKHWRKKAFDCGMPWSGTDSPRRAGETPGTTRNDGFDCQRKASGAFRRRSDITGLLSS